MQTWKAGYYKLLRKIKADTKAHFARDNMLILDCINYARGPTEYADFRDEEENLPSAASAIRDNEEFNERVTVASWF